MPGALFASHPALLDYTFFMIVLMVGTLKLHDMLCRFLPLPEKRSNQLSYYVMNTARVFFVSLRFDRHRQNKISRELM
jgi:hypothetical protein